MNHIICTCGAVFTESPILSLLEHREREHCPYCGHRARSAAPGWRACRKCSSWWQSEIAS